MFTSTLKRGRTSAIYALTVLMALMLGAILLLPATGAAAASLPTTPASGTLGTTFTLTGTGYTPGERVNLSTIDPQSSVLAASYILADTSGNFTVKVYTTDPNGLAANAGTNYATLATDYDSSGNVVDQYLQLTLLKPAIGAWSLYSTGSSSGISQSYAFTITAPGAATTSSTNPAAGAIGTVFTLKGSGFQPGERVNLWTTDPTSKALGAGYILADASGNIMVQVNSSDPSALAAAAGGNYSTLQTDYNSDGNVVDHYLQVILYTPSAGSWHLTAQGATDGSTQVFNFAISQ